MLTAAAEQISATRNRTRLRLITSCVAALIVLVAVARWITSASAFDSGNEVGVRTARPGVAHHFSLVGRGQLPDVTIRDVRVELSERSGPADTTVRVCPVAATIGAVSGTLDCPDLSIRGLDLGAVAGTHDLLLTVVPRGSLPVVVEGVIVGFSDGLRRGTERVGPRVVLTSEAANTDGTP